MPCKRMRHRSELKVQSGYVDLTNERGTKKALEEEKKKSISEMKRVMPLP